MGFSLLISVLLQCSWRTASRENESPFVNSSDSKNLNPHHSVQFFKILSPRVSGGDFKMELLGGLLSDSRSNL